MNFRPRIQSYNFIDELRQYDESRTIGLILLWARERNKNKKREEHHVPMGTGNQSATIKAKRKVPEQKPNGDKYVCICIDIHQKREQMATDNGRTIDY